MALTIEQKLEELKNNEEKTMDSICTHVANGGSLIELAKIWGVTYGALSNWLRKEKARATRWVDAQNDRTEWGKEAILLELRRIGMSDIRILFNEDGSIKPVTEWPDEAGAFVSSIEVVEEFEGTGKDRLQTGWNKKIKMWSKEKSLELLGKNLKLFLDRVEHSGNLTLEGLIAQSLEPDKEEGEQQR